MTYAALALTQIKIAAGHATPSNSVNLLELLPTPAIAFPITSLILQATSASLATTRAPHAQTLQTRVAPPVLETASSRQMPLASAQLDTRILEKRHASHVLSRIA
ncbi:MAG: hypothetical protein QF535_22815 [Anaerolineales bacterium]|jgi:hypothetical protein|nr:hypothetical protein [Anaerolineales bacterium]